MKCVHLYSDKVFLVEMVFVKDHMGLLPYMCSHVSSVTFRGLVAKYALLSGWGALIRSFLNYYRAFSHL